MESVQTSSPQASSSSTNRVEQQSNEQQPTQVQPQPQQQQATKKLYFKASATEALHSAILLKARNSNCNSASSTSSTGLVASNRRATATSELVRTIPPQPKNGNFQVHKYINIPYLMHEFH